jgi:hypothetical protein
MNTENNLSTQVQPRCQQDLDPAPRALATVPATPADIVLYAMKNGGSIEQIRDFMQLQREWEADQARKAYVADMAEFKKNPPTIVKDKLVGYENKDGTFTGYKHATLGNVTNAIVEGLAAHGFSHSWDVKQDGSMATVTCKITHRMGHSESVSMQAAKDDSGKKNQIQQVASAITYLQRYTLLAATGLATHDQADDDGQAAALDTALADKWCGAAARAADLPALEQVWKDGDAEIKAKGTDFDFRDFVAAVNGRKAKLTAPPREANKSSRLNDIVGKAGPAPQQAAE